MTPETIDTRPELADVSPAMWERIDAIIAGDRGRPGRRSRCCASARHRRYLPQPLIGYIAAGLGLPRAEVFGVATFYSLFTLTPRGRHCIKVCEGTACYVRGIKEVIGRIRDTHQVGIGETTEDRRFSLESVRCLGACGLAPVVVVDQDTTAA